MEEIHKEVQQSICVIENRTNRIKHLVRAEGFIIPRVSNLSCECEIYRQRLCELFPNNKFYYVQTYSKCIFSMI